MRPTPAILLSLTLAVSGCTRGDFQLTPPSDPVTLLRGHATELTFGLDRLKGFNQGVDLLVTLVPDGVICPETETPLHVRPGDTSAVLSFLAYARSTPGTTGTIRLTATADGGLTRTVDVPVSIQDPGGALDATFGTSGRVEETAVAANAGICGAAVDPAGNAWLARIQDHFTLEQLNPSGIPSDLGIYQVAPTASGATWCGLAVNANAAFIAATSPDASGVPTPFVFGLQTNMTASPGFGTGGRVTLPTSNELAADLAFTSDGRLLVLTSASTGLGLTRLTGAGQVDSTFGAGGRVSIAGQFSGRPRVAPLPDGRVLVSTSVVPSPGATGQLVLYQLSASGSPDPTFGTQGVLTLDVPDVPQGLIPTVAAMAVLSSGSLLLSVEVPPLGSSDGDAGRLIQLLSSGQPDTSFGTNGVVKLAPTPNVPGSTYGLRGLAVLPDGRFVGVGTARTATGHRLGLYRFLSSGSLDGSFGQGAPLLISESTPRDASGSSESEARALALYPDGRMLIAGDIGLAGSANLGTLLARYWP